MARTSSLPLLLSIFSLLLTSSLFPAAVRGDGESETSQSSTTSQFFDSNSNEFEMDSETNRRTLLENATVFISYSALLADRVPCSLLGASYYNCFPGASANPYIRGCSTITRCRR